MCSLLGLVTIKEEGKLGQQVDMLHSIYIKRGQITCKLNT
jgi:hypothetical protein